MQQFKPSRRLFLVASLAVILIALTALVPLAINHFFPPQVEVHFIHVNRDPTLGDGVGDSILLRSSEGDVVLIDGGYQGSGVVEYLAAQNVTHIDTVILSHSHEDHYGGLIDVLRAVPVDRVVTNGQSSENPLFQDLLDAIGQSGAQNIVVKAGDRVPFGRLSFQVLSPSKIAPDTVNNNSIVMRLSVGQVSFLFTGDMMELLENHLIESGAPLKVDILKVGHHAINTSTKGPFALAVQPSVAIYSVGSHNIYGSPDPKVLENLAAVGAETFGTQIYGNIIVQTDGRTYTVETELTPPSDQ